jgi:muconolactone delta-isomerase
MPDGRLLGPFADREEAIRAEEEALAQLLAREGAWRP